MLPLFTKQLEVVDSDDIDQLVSEGFPEGSTVEYKETLPCKERQDPWFTGASQISDRARNSILKEVVAFANSHGGHVLVGIQESNDKPARAVDVKPIPRCTQLAEKFRLQARDCIEPQVPVIHTWGVETDPSGAGVLIIRVPQSRAAPHRLIPTGECYYRHADRSEKMTMREIQDLTLKRERGLASIDAKFTKRRDLFYQRYTFPNPEYQHEHQIRVTLIPVSASLWIEAVYKNTILSPLFQCFVARMGGREFPLTLPRVGLESRPILGGVRYIYGARENDLRLRVELLRDGTLEYAFLSPLKPDPPLPLSPEWVIGLATNAILMANRFRECAGVPGVEYGLEVEVKRTSGPLLVSRLGAQPFPAAHGIGVIGEAEPNPLIFQRFSIGSPDEFSKVIAILYRDLVNAAGADPETDLEVIIPDELITL